MRFICEATNVARLKTGFRRLNLWIGDGSLFLDGSLSVSVDFFVQPNVFTFRKYAHLLQGVRHEGGTVGFLALECGRQALGGMVSVVLHTALD